MTQLKADSKVIVYPRVANPGVETLRRMANVDRYNEWIYKTISPHIGERILEVGCGIGNMTPFFLGATSLTCIDLLPESVAQTRQALSAHVNGRAVLADICDQGIIEQLGPMTYDTIACINVLEHIESDSTALRHMYELMKPGGKLLLFVPAGEYLYGHLDRALGHHRRYSRRALRDVTASSGFQEVSSFHMNVAGIPGWLLSSRLLKRTAPPRQLLRLFNILTPLLIRMEAKLQPQFGLSLVLIGVRPAS